MSINNFGLFSVLSFDEVNTNQINAAKVILKSTGKSCVYTRLVGLDRETNKELLLKHIKSNGKKGTPFMELQLVLPSFSRRQIQELLSELRTENRILVEGTTKNAKWFLV